MADIRPMENMETSKDTLNVAVEIPDKGHLSEGVASCPDIPCTKYPTGLRLVAIMTSLVLGTMLMALDATIISVATPAISTQFRALEDVGWYGAAYSMLFTAMTPVSSNFYKHFDPKVVYLCSILIFEGMSSRPCK